MDSASEEMYGSDGSFNLSIGKYQQAIKTRFLHYFQVVKLSLLKAPKNPDANCDIHKHFIHYAILPHQGSFQESDVIRRAYEFNYFSANNTPVVTGASGFSSSWLTVDNPAVVVGAFKPAHDIPNALVVRLYESHGGNATTS